MVVWCCLEPGPSWDTLFQWLTIQAKHRQHQRPSPWTAFSPLPSAYIQTGYDKFSGKSTVSFLNICIYSSTHQLSSSKYEDIEWPSLANIPPHPSTHAASLTRVIGGLNVSRGTQYCNIEQTAINFYLDENGDSFQTPNDLVINLDISEDPWSPEQLELVAKEKELYVYVHVNFSL